jgi:hypothetical protein
VLVAWGDYADWGVVMAELTNKKMRLKGALMFGAIVGFTVGFVSATLIIIVVLGLMR